MLVQEGIKISKGTLKTNKGFEENILNKEWKGLLKIEFETIHLQIQFLEKSINELENELVKFAAPLPGYKNIVSIKGIGALSAATIIAVIDDINDFKRPERLASYFGIVPIIRESNDVRKTGRITKAGSCLGRRALTQCIYSVIRYNPELKKFYERIKKRRGTGKAIIASSRKLLVIIFYTLKNDWIHDDFPAHKYHVRKAAE